MKPQQVANPRVGLIPGASPSPLAQRAAAINQAIWTRMNYRPPPTPQPAPSATADTTGVDYSSVDAMKDAKKVEFLKRTDFDPDRLKNPFDMFNSYMYRAQKIIQNMNEGPYSDADKTKILNGIYDRMIMPFYNRTKGEMIKGTEAPSRKQWLAHAQDFAKEYDINQTYMNSWWSGLAHGSYGLLNEAFQGIKTVNDIVGTAVSPHFWNQFGHEFFKAPQEITDDSWQKQVEYDRSHPAWNFFKEAEKEGRYWSMFHKVQNWANHNSNEAEMYQRLTPLRTYRAAVTNLAVQAIPFVAVEAATEGLGLTGMGGGELQSIGRKALVDWHGSPTAGRVAEAMLHGARDGFIYNSLTRPAKDKAKAVTDALEWGAAGSVLTLAGSPFMFIGGKLIKLGVRGAASASGDRILGDVAQRFRDEAADASALKGQARDYKAQQRLERQPRVGPEEPPEVQGPRYVDAPYRGVVAPKTIGEAIRRGEPVDLPEGRTRMPASMEARTRQGEISTTDPRAQYRGIPPAVPESPARTPDSRPAAPVVEEPAAVDQALQEHSNRGKLIDAGREEVPPEVARDVSEAGVAETIAKHGVLGQEAVTQGAMQHILDMESSDRTPEQVRDFERNMLENGSDGDRILLDQVMRIRDAVRDAPLNSLDHQGKVQLVARLQALAHDASGRMTKHVATLQEALRMRFNALPPDTLDANIKRYLLSQMQLPPNTTPEQAAAAIQKKWGDLVLEAGKAAEEHAVADPVGKAEGAKNARQRAEDSKPEPLNSRMVARTRRTTGARGDAVSFSYVPEWVVYAKNAVKKASKNWTPEDIRQWVKDLSEDDFAADLQAFFLPKVLTEGDLWFEKNGVADDRDYTNLYAFAYNYKDSMPTEMAAELERRFQDAPKMNRFFSETRSPREQMGMARRIALTMWNHVDNLLSSGRWPKESNIFRSTATDWVEPTKWMQELFEERDRQDRDVIDKMFSKDTPESKAAHGALTALADDRVKAYNERAEGKTRLLTESIRSAIKKATKAEADKRVKYKDPWEAVRDIANWETLHGRPATGLGSMFLVGNTSLLKDYGQYGQLRLTSEGRPEVHLPEKLMAMFNDGHTRWQDYHGPTKSPLGMNQDVDAVRAIAHRIYNEPGRGTLADRTFLTGLMLHATAAPDTSHGVSFLGSHIPDEHIHNTRREEWGHGFQRWLADRKTAGRGDIRDHISNKGYNEVIQAVNRSKGMLNYMDALYRDADPRVKVLEAAIKAVVVDPKYLKIPEEEAFQIAKTYLTVIKNEHGGDVLSELGAVFGVKTAELKKFYATGK